jgi:two-component system KDP operon response regulator KdpE
MIKPPVPPISVGALSVDLSSRLVALNGARVPLTQKEYRLLQILAQSAGQVVTHTRLLSEIWGKGSLESSHYLRILVRRVRQKIETNPSRPRLLVTELGVGYSLSPGGM